MLAGIINVGISLCDALPKYPDLLEDNPQEKSCLREISFFLFLGDLKTNKMKKKTMLVLPLHDTRKDVQVKTKISCFLPYVGKIRQNFYERWWLKNSPNKF